MDGNSSSGGQNRSSQSHLDFISYWADQTVEQEIIRGHKLREIKPYAFPKREYDVVNIDYIKPPPSMKSGSYRRKKSRESCANCTYCKGISSPSKSEAKSHKNRKQKKKYPCGMRTAELAVPSKRQCLDAWRRNYDKLPAHMVERLRQYVMNQRPVVEIADAIHCFKRKKSVKKEKGKRKKACDKNITLARLKPLKSRDVKTLCALFGHSIAKKLITPLKIELNSGLENIANVVSLDIYDLMQKSKKVNMKTKKYRDMHIDVTKKITIWVSDVLEESAYKILEDQYKDFEEEAGPALDFIDELIDNVVNIGEPEPEIKEIAWTASEDLESSEEESTESDKDQAVIESDMTQETVEDHVQDEIIGIIDSIFKDINIQSDDEKQDTNDNGQIEDTKSDHDVYVDVENEPDNEPSEFADANDNFEDNLQANEANEDVDNQNENAIDEENIEGDEDGSQKVKFHMEGEEIVYEYRALMGYEPENTEKTPEKSSETHIDFALPNEDLLSDADESWPAEIQLPIVRPSQSASKSVTSLGNIAEDEEKAAPNEQDEDGNGLQETTTSDDIEGQKIQDAENISVAPEDFAMASEETEMAPEETSVTPEDASMMPDKDIGSPEDTIVAVEDIAVIPKDAAVASEETEIAPEETSMTSEPMNPDKTVGALEDTVEAAEDITVAPKYTELGFQETKMAPEKTDIASENMTSITPNYTVVASEDASSSENKFVSSEDTVEAAKDTAVALKDTALASEEIDMAPEETSMALEDTVVAAEDTVVASDDKIIGGEDIVVAPKDIAVASEEIEMAPKETGIALEDIEVAADDTVLAFKDTVLAIEDTVVAAEDTGVASEELKMSPEERSVVPGDTLVASDDTVVAFVETSMVPEDTPMGPDKTVGAPEDTVVATEGIIVTSEDKVERKRTKKDTNKGAKPTEMESADKSKEDKGSLPQERKKLKAIISPERKPVTSEKVIPTPKPKTEKSADDKTKNLMKTKINKAIVKKKSPRKEKIIDIETAGTSRSVKDLSEDGRATAKDIQFASLRVKKNNYRVNVSTAPSWVTRTNGEPTCVCIDMDPQPKTRQQQYRPDNNIRKWVRDLEQGYENLKLWNEWIDTTSRTINILQQEIGGIVQSEQCNKNPVNKLLELKTNIEKDATLWRKLRRCTRDRLRNYRPYQINKVRDCSTSLLN